jgi:hypothetical protein
LIFIRHGTGDEAIRPIEVAGSPEQADPQPPR